MMKPLIQIAYSSILLMAVGVWPSGEATSFAVKNESVTESMRRLADEMIAAYERRDTTALKQFYAKQPDALFFWERKMKYSWPEIARTMDDLVRLVAKIDLTVGEFRSGGSGSAGWFAATFHAERVTPEGKQFSSDGRWTVIAEKVNGQWRIVHEHTSFPLPER